MPPSPEAQIRFLINLQRLLDEGLFVASYKFCLLLALADLCVEDGDDSGAALKITTEAIASKFIQYYWGQAVPYPCATEPRILRQNTGPQAAILKIVLGARKQYGDSITRLMNQTVDCPPKKRRRGFD